MAAWGLGAPGQGRLGASGPGALGALGLGGCPGSATAWEANHHLRASTRGVDSGVTGRLPPNLLESTRLCTCLPLQLQDLAKKLKNESGGLDLMGYIELQR